MSKLTEVCPDRLDPGVYVISVIQKIIEYTIGGGWGSLHCKGGK